MIRIVVAERDVDNADALGLRRALIESGVPLRAIAYERVAFPPGIFGEVGWHYLPVGTPLRRDWGWAIVVKPACLGLEAIRSPKVSASHEPRRPLRPS